MIRPEPISPQIILATSNPHKTREFRKLLAPEILVSDLSAFPEISPPAETGATFEENAALKAVDVSKQLKGLIAADDSGLEVDALSGKPGVYSARYAGEKATNLANIDKLLHQLRASDVPADQRSARFRCVIALARGGELLETFYGAVDGKIVDPPRGHRGFGYDPVFQPDGFELTFAEIPEEVKHRISHRARAAKQLRDFLRTVPLRAKT